MLGPIPARTGQPLAYYWRSRAMRAYPRSHGATVLARGVDASHEGLSPLARGNLIGFAIVGVWAGPIPARTGQPACIPS